MTVVCLFVSSWPWILHREEASCHYVVVGCGEGEFSSVKKIILIIIIIKGVICIDGCVLKYV